MQLVRRFGGQVRRALPTSMLVAGALFANACSSDSTGAGPIIPGQPTPNPQITKAAFLADVNLRTKTIKITRSGAVSLLALLERLFISGGGGPAEIFAALTSKRSERNSDTSARPKAQAQRRPKQ
jgi:hypothetical protein